MFLSILIRVRILHNILFNKLYCSWSIHLKIGLISFPFRDIHFLFNVYLFYLFHIKFIWYLFLFESISLRKLVINWKYSKHMFIQVFCYSRTKNPNLVSFFFIYCCFSALTISVERWKLFFGIFCRNWLFVDDCCYIGYTQIIWKRHFCIFCRFAAQWYDTIIFTKYNRKNLDHINSSWAYL